MEKEKLKKNGDFLIETAFLVVAAYLITYGAASLMAPQAMVFKNEGFLILPGMFLFPLAWERWVKKITPGEIGFSLPAGMLTECFIGSLCLAILLTYNFLMSGTGGLKELPAHLSVHHFFNCMLIALGEETLFRGILLRRISRLWGIIPGALVTSLLFAFAAHPSAGIMANLSWRLPASLILCYLYLRKGNLIMPITIHLILNLLLYQCPE